MKDQIGKSFGFLKTTGLGGIFFLLPLAVVCGLLGYVFNIVWAVYEPLKERIPVSSATGVALLFAIAVGILVLLCFVSGIIARRAIGRKFSKTIEKQLMTIFPKYAVYKDLLAGNIGGEGNLPSLKPICVRFDDVYHLAFEADRLANGLVVVYLAGAPDAWIGQVALVPAERIEAIDVPFSEFLGIFEGLGRDSSTMLASVTTQQF